MMEQEGVIKYSLDFQHKALSVTDSILSDLNTCRSVMIANGLLGQDEHRYHGYGFGNLSIRHTDSTESSAFLISGSQTGQLNSLAAKHLSCITHINVKQNNLCAYGDVEPSSESMTHGVLYQQNDQIKAVVHVHSPEIWQHADCLGLAATAKDIPYGTPEMAIAVQKLSSTQSSLPIIFVMKGHEDGVVAAGTTFAQCTHVLLETLHRAKIISES